MSVSIYDITKELRRESLSVRPRLELILHDIAFVQSLGLPTIANERCGLWYVHPDDRIETSYFKSTDGHTNQWSFSLRRLNLHLLPVFCQYGKVAIVDSTRKGKLMPDALSKTIPMWCAVLNALAYGEAELRTPASMVSPNEHNQMEKRVPLFVEQLLELGVVDAASLRQRLNNKRLYPVWHTPTKPNRQALPKDVLALHLVTASSTDGPFNGYVQGAADDHESWASFGPDEFWSHVYGLGSKIGNLLEAELQALLAEAKPVEGPALDVSELSIGGFPILFGALKADVPVTYIRTTYPEIEQVVTLAPFQITGTHKEVSVVHHSLESGKKGSRQLRTILPALIPKLVPKPTLVLCDTGKDLAVGVVLALVCVPGANKTAVKQNLAAILEARKVNPSRSTLQAVNTYLAG